MNPTTKHKNIALFRTPKGELILILFFTALVPMIHSRSLYELKNLSISIITSVLIDLLYRKIDHQKMIFPSGAILTGMIVALIISNDSSAFIVALTSSLAIMSKQLIRKNFKPVFNPAAFGLLISIFLFSTKQDWWGGLPTLPHWYLILLLIFGYKITYKINKFPLVFSFLGTYFFLTLVLGVLQIEEIGNLLRTPYLNSTLFLAFFMATDPPTSPTKLKDQIIYGSIISIISLISYLLIKNLSFLFIGLLVANIWKALSPSFIFRSQMNDKLVPDRSHK